MTVLTIKINNHSLFLIICSAEMNNQENKQDILYESKTKGCENTINYTLYYQLSTQHLILHFCRQESILQVGHTARIQ